MSAVTGVLTSAEAQAIIWGPEQLCVYNDAYSRIIVDQHPRVLGNSFFDSFSEVRELYMPVFDDVRLTGRPYLYENLPVIYKRHGCLEQTYNRVSLCPILEDGRVAGIFATVTDLTRQVLSERRIAALQKLSLACAGASSPRGVAEAALSALADAADLPALLLYMKDPSPRCVAVRGFTPSTEAIAEQSTLAWGLDVVQQTRASHAVARMPDNVRLEGGPTHKRSSAPHALTLPLRAESDSLRGYLVVVFDPHLPFDTAYRDFIELVAAHIGSAMERAESWLKLRHQAEQLSVLDKAKTEFFSNISHEFRTPLTLMLNPIKDALDDCTPLAGDDLRLVQRNAQRLLKLVNALLDFSRAEAGRSVAERVPTDVAAATRDIASAFRAVAQRAGLQYTVECQPRAIKACVDRDMWEKIVLNLLSNAFKNTVRGKIEVCLGAANDGVLLTVRDTGAGIAAGQLPRIFQRFVRVEGPQSVRSEGSGIGLSLTQELCRLHGGDVQVQSVEGEGSTFSVLLPWSVVGVTAAPSHAPQSALGLAGPYVDEALGWFAGDDTEPSIPTSQSALRVLVVDDNADMRDYLARLFRQRWQVSVARNGHEALLLVRKQPPDLIVCDIMMPELDGLGFLTQLRADAALQAIPVILLSARNGEQETVAGMQAGADDYLAKPFASRELVARVESQLALSALRKAAVEQTHRIGEMERGRGWAELLLNSSPLPMLLLSPETGAIRFANSAARAMLGDGGTEAPAQDGTAAIDTACAANTDLMGHMAVLAQTARLEPVRDKPLALHTSARTYALLVSAERIPESYGRASQIAVAFKDVTALRRTEADLRAALKSRDSFLSVAMHEMRTPLAPILLKAASIKLKLEPQRKNMPCLEKAILGLDSIMQSGHRLERLVGDLMDMARCESADLPSRPARVNLMSVLNEQVEELERTGQAAQWGCEIRLRAETTPVGQWDAGHMRMLVRCLLSNAIKFGDRRPVDVVLRPEGSGLALCVRDRGIGVATEHQARIFGKFERAVSDRQYGGLGLGLWIAKCVVAASGGMITVNSEAGRGSTFRAWLPWRSPAVPQ